MRKIITVVAAAVVALGALLGTAAPASASGHEHQPKVTSVNVIGPIWKTSATTALLFAVYSCTGTAEQTHVWISVKQNATRTADPALKDEGSGGGHIATAWSQTHAASLTCDGRKHLGAFTVDQKEQGYGTLGRGWAYMQFCLFDANYPQEPLSVMQFRRLL
ncbi:hypothetical protein [Leifsonia poae]|uniref:Uncharacterized protein n=1 Tax=Leifsonia poae TaxID=110933 RepID=A0A9W6HC94_9MICO|nr:hypothetical protein [Leifsonia poae]GLJ77138.1 hypothetical protein GCM10017584_27120 [Leifsonia poae]